jgi:hypothetical protein
MMRGKGARVIVGSWSCCHGQFRVRRPTFPFVSAAPNTLVWMTGNLTTNPVLIVAQPRQRASQEAELSRRSKPRPGPVSIGDGHAAMAGTSVRGDPGDGDAAFDGTTCPTASPTLLLGGARAFLVGALRIRHRFDETADRGFLLFAAPRVVGCEASGSQRFSGVSVWAPGVEPRLGRSIVVRWKAISIVPAPVEQGWVLPASAPITASQAGVAQGDDGLSK